MSLPQAHSEDCTRGRSYGGVLRHLNAVFGIWWADPLIALLIAIVAAWEGWATWKEAVEKG